MTKKDLPPNCEDAEKFEHYRRTVAAREQLVKEGLLVDSGKRRRNPQSGLLEVVYEKAPKGLALARDILGEGTKQ